MDERKQVNLVTPAPLCFDTGRSSVRLGSANTLLQFTHRRCSAGHKQGNSHQGVALGHELLALHNRAVLDCPLHRRQKSQRSGQLVVTTSGVTRAPNTT
jgi:hypothetical protein